MVRRWRRSYIGAMGATTTHKDEVVGFLHEVHSEGLISDFMAETLLNYRSRQTGQVASEAPVHPAFAPASPARVVSQSVRPSPAPESTRQPAPAFMPAPPRRRSRAEIWARYARKRSKRMWGTLSADFAANALTYLGVMLSVVVIFVFFAFGYFAEFIDADHKQYRPLAEAGVVAFFLGLAWVLRHRTGIPQTSAAIEMIGIILIPVMLSASFRDGCTPSYRPWCLPPDVDGPARWAAYGIVALVTTTIYYAYARRRAIYSYLVGPMFWIAVGAFALYLDDGIRLVRYGNDLDLARFTSDGISSPQLIAVLAAVSLTIAAAARTRHLQFGARLAVPIVRSAVVAVPLVLVGSLVFAYNDAVARGVANPTLADIAWPNVIASGLGAVAFVAASRCGFAWADLSERVRGEIYTGLRLMTHLSLAAAWLFTAGFGVTVAWLGAGLVGYAIVVAVFSRQSDISHAVWLVRGAALVGSVLALIDPGPAAVTWSAIAGLMMLRSTAPAVANVVARYLPNPVRQNDRLAQLWLAVLTAIGAGLGRLAWPDGAPIALLAATAVLAAARLVGHRDIRTLARIPAAIVAGGAVAVELYRQTFAIGWSPYPLGLFLASVALVFAFTTVLDSVRLTATVSLLAAAVGVALREYLGSGLWTTTWADTSVLAVFGVVLVGAGALRRSAMRFTPILGHVFVAAAVVRSLPYEETLVLGLVTVLLTYGFEAIRIEKGQGSVFGFVEWVPALIALGSTLPLTVLVARQLSYFVNEAPRFGPLLAGLAWFQLGLAIPSWQRVRTIAVPLAYATSLAAMLVAIPSETAMLITTVSAAVLTAAVAVAARQPLLTTVSWILGVGAALLAASRGGVEADSLHLVLHLVSLSMVVAAALVIRSRWSGPAALVGAVLLPVATAASDGSWTAWLALSAAGAYAWLGWSTRLGLFSLPTAAGIAVGYAAVLNGNGWASVADEALWWMPLAAAFVAASALVPGRRRWRMVIDPAPGLLVSGLVLCGVTLAGTAATAVALVCVALVLVEAYVIRRDELWLGGAVLSLLVAGLIAASFWAPLATLMLALVAGYLADRHRADDAGLPMRVLAAASIVATHALVAAWLAWNAGQTIAATAIVAAVFLTLAVLAEMAPSLPSRIRTWRVQAFWISQFGALAAMGIASVSLSEAGAAGVIVGVLAVESLVAGLMGTFRRSSGVNIGAAFLAAGAYSQLPVWLAWSPDEYLVATGLVALALALIATMATRGRAESARLDSWVAALHGLTGAAVLGVLAEALSPSATDQDFWLASAVLVAVGAHLAANAWAAPQELPVRGAAVVSVLAGALCAAVAADFAEGPLLATSLAAAGLGLVVAIGAGSVANTTAVWRRELVGMFAGLEVIAVGGLLQRYQPLDTETGAVLVVVGAALAGYGILARHLEIVELALVAWLGAFLVLVNDQIGMSMHAAALTASVALLGVLELERVRYEIDDVTVPQWVDQAEWLLMMAPLTLAAAEMFGHLWFGLVLFGEGLALGAWGTATQVRRRAFLGVGAIVLSVVLTAAIPAVHGLMVGLAAGTWLAIGAIAAVVFIAAGSAIERQRHAIGRGLARIGEIVDHWS